MAAGQLIEDVTGRSWEEFVAEEVLAPAGMVRNVAGIRMKAVSPLADFSYDYRDLHFTPVTD